jgi:hypothetical protein
VRNLAVVVFYFFSFQTESIAQKELQDFTSNNIQEYLWPEENEVVFNQNIELKWHASLPSKSYNLQVATDKNFEQKILDTFTEKQFCLIKKLARHKNYFWRIVHDVKDIDHKHKNTEYSFFKTTSIHMEESQNNTDVSLIPSWIDNNELIYIDNPEKLEYLVTVIRLEENSKIFSRKTNNEKQSILTQDWPRGRYIVDLKIGDRSNQFTEITLTQN